MDIRQLKYFVKIVEQNFNISATAEMLFVSQSTLSVAITKFETQEQVDLFERVGGRLVALTEKGEEFYQSALSIINFHDEMMEALRSDSISVVGTIKIGIPPFVLSVIFSEVLTKLIMDNPHIKFEIVEAGAYQLEKDLILGDIDLAILLAPGLKTNDLIDSYELYSSEISCFMSPQHELASKKVITWEELHHRKMAICDSTFMLHHMLKHKFERHNVSPEFIFESRSWDFLINSTILNPDSLILLPHPIVNIYSFDNLLEKPMEYPIPWKVTVTRLKKKKYSNIQSYVLEQLLISFNEPPCHSKLNKSAINLGYL